MITKDQFLKNYWWVLKDHIPTNNTWDKNTLEALFYLMYQEGYVDGVSDRDRDYVC